MQGFNYVIPSSRGADRALRREAAREVGEGERTEHEIGRAGVGAVRSELCQLFNESYVFYSQRRQFAALTVAELYYAFALWPQSQLQSIYLHCPADWIFSHIFTLETQRRVREC